MRNRFDNAVMIGNGAGNLAAIARSLVAACDEAMEECQSTEGVWADPAVRLIVNQMGFLTNDHLLSGQEYITALEFCEENRSK